MAAEPPSQEPWSFGTGLFSARPSMPEEGFGSGELAGFPLAGKLDRACIAFGLELEAPHDLVVAPQFIDPVFH